MMPASLQIKALNQLHLNYMSVEKTRPMACEYIYWINMNADIEEAVSNCSTSLDFQAT